MGKHFKLIRNKIENTFLVFGCWFMAAGLAKGLWLLEKPND